MDRHLTLIRHQVKMFGNSEPWERVLFVLLLGAGLLAHQFIYILAYRRKYLTLSFAPALGIKLSRPAFTLVQIAGIPTAVTLMAFGGRATTLAALAILLLWSSIQSLRISNHIWLAFFGALVLAFSDAAEQVTEARFLLGYLYFAAAVFKCSKEFLLSDRSVAKVIINNQADSFNLRAPKAFLALAPAVVALAELGAGVMLFLDYRLDIAFLVCAVLHLTFGIVGNVHFALISLAFWHEALGGSLPVGELIAGNAPLLMTALAIGALSGYFIGNNTLHGSRLLGGSADAFLVGIYCAATALVWESATASTLREGKWSVGATVILVAFLVNFVLLFLGLKGEWAFAMFSNLRPYGKAKVFGFSPRWRATYFRVEWDGDFPKPVSDALAEQVAAQIKGGRHVVSGPVAHELASLAGATGVKLRFVPQKFDENAEGFIDLEQSAATVKGGPIWVAPIISRDPAATYMG